MNKPATSHLGGFKLLKNVPPGACPECALEHLPTWPHNQQSLYYQYHFRERHGRWPTWADAMAHCDEETSKYWTRELERMGLLPPEGGTPTAETVMPKDPPLLFVDVVRPAVALIEQYGMVEFLCQYSGFLRSMIGDYNPMLWQKALETIGTFPASHPDPEPALTAAFLAYLQQERDSAILDEFANP